MFSTCTFCGLPKPINNLPALFAKNFTHDIPSLSIAWEEGESYQMKIPPRKKAVGFVISDLAFYLRFLAVQQLPVPVVCCINGPAIGAGLSFAMGDAWLPARRVRELQPMSIRILQDILSRETHDGVLASSALSCKSLSACSSLV